jgi:ParB/RepB/Spo0J family partition protein
MKLMHIPLSKVQPNPENPRGIDIETQDDKLSYLKQSIQGFGVLVPIVVSKKNDHYILIDGERRYWASKALNLTELPAFVIDDKGKLDDSAILYRMFQIHHNREQWGPVQQCHALEAAYRAAARKPSIRSLSDERAKLCAVAEELVRATGIETRTALNRVHFLRWPTSIKQRLYRNPGEQGYWYICEIEEKIIIPALVNFPEYFSRVPANEVRCDLFRKLEEHSVLKSTEVRRVAPFFRGPVEKATERRAVQKVLSELRNNVAMTYSDAQDELLKALPDYRRSEPVSPRKLESLLTRMTATIEDFDVAAIGAAQRRAKAPREKLQTAAAKLVASLQNLMEQLSEGDKR